MGDWANKRAAWIRLCIRLGSKWQSTFRKCRRKLFHGVLTASRHTLLKRDPETAGNALLRQTTAQWLAGDWEGLASLDHRTITNVRRDTTLALFAATGHHQIGNHDVAGAVVRKAVSEGCAASVLRRILISGVENSLGRAALLAGNSERALKHFESAISTLYPGGNSTKRALERFTTQAAQFDLCGSHIAPDRPTLDGSDSIEDWDTGIADSRYQRPVPDYKANIWSAPENFSRLEKSIDEIVRSEIRRSTQYLESFLAVQDYLNTGNLAPHMRGWPIGPDLAIAIFSLLERNRYNHVVEFGSGSSTFLIAMALRNYSLRHERACYSSHFAFEHLEEYLNQTRHLLRRAELENQVALVHSPLRTYAAPNGKNYQFYNCFETLAKMGTSRSENVDLLVLVDGPPASTGKHARYPALPVILETMPNVRCDIVLDDYRRNDEREVAELWITHLKDLGIPFHIHDLETERGACLFSFENRRR